MGGAGDAVEPREIRALRTGGADQVLVEKPRTGIAVLRGSEGYRDHRARYLRANPADGVNQRLKFVHRLEQEARQPQPGERLCEEQVVVGRVPVGGGNRPHVCKYLRPAFRRLPCQPDARRKHPFQRISVHGAGASRERVGLDGVRARFHVSAVDLNNPRRIGKVRHLAGLTDARQRAVVGAKGTVEESNVDWDPLRFISIRYRLPM